MTTISFKPGNKKPVPTAATEYFDDVALNPGLNKVADKDLDTLESNPVFNYYQDIDVVEVLKNPDSSKSTASTTTRKARTAKKVDSAKEADTDA